MLDYLITGGAGFIGRNLCKELESLGKSFKAIDTRGKGVMHCDVTRDIPHQLEAEVLVHLAAEEEYTAAMLSTELQRAKNALVAEKMKPQPLSNKPSSLPNQAMAATSKPEACPSCGAQLVKRRVSGGRMDGNYVMACPNYPSCRHLMPLTVQAVTSG